MNAASKKAQDIVDYISITLFVFCACMVLFLVDRESNGIIDLFTTQNIVALFLYAIPTTLFCFFLFRLCLRKFRKNPSYLITLVLGIPFGFTVMLFLLDLMGRV